MPGLIESQMQGGAPAAPQQDPAAPAAPGAAPSGGGQITPESVMQGLHLQPAQQEPLQRIVLAGKKVMYSEQTHAIVAQTLQGPGPLPKKLGEGIAGLMGMLAKEAKGALPAPLLIPAGMVLVAEGADFMRRAGQQVTDVDVGQAFEYMVGAVLRVMKIDPAKLGTGAAPGAPAAPAAAPQGGV